MGADAISTKSRPPSNKEATASDVSEARPPRRPRFGAPAALLPIAFALAYVAVMEPVARHFGASRAAVWRGGIVLLPLIVIGFSASVLRQLIRRGPKGALASALEDAPTALALQLVCVPMLNVFAHYKGVLHVVQPFYADTALMQLDRLLHFGHHAWELIPLWPWLTWLLDRVYFSWYWVLLVALTLWAWLGSDLPRARLFLAYFLCWAVLGSLAATLLSSAGPVYYERIGLAPDEYAPLFQYLARFELHASGLQEYLWRGFQGEVRAEGISAMPSLHVALPALFTVSIWHLRWLRWIGVVFTALILVGSVHLGWHYAVDGYLAFAGVWLVWALSGRIMRAWPGTARRLA